MAVTNFDDRAHAAGKFRDAINKRLLNVLGFGLVKLPGGPDDSDTLIVAHFSNSDQYHVHFGSFVIAARFVATRRNWRGLPIAIFPDTEAAVATFDPALAIEKGIAVPINK